MAPLDDGQLELDETLVVLTPSGARGHPIMDSPHVAWDAAFPFPQPDELQNPDKWTIVPAAWAECVSPRPKDKP